MYFTVSLYYGLEDYKQSSKLTTITSAVAFLKSKPKCLGFHFEFFEDDGLKLRCHPIEINIGEHPKNISFYSRFRSISKFRKVLSGYLAVAKEYELFF